ncbi:MAG TPA: Uma2 family endonuclease [Gemmataceae bacterium]|jgi:Uma2 family endonuclease|nr:Uma2 family endonuclease [Gemmataceae bacterium]
MTTIRSAPSYARISGKDVVSLPAVTDTVADLIRRLGDIAPERILLNPPLGTATEEDVIRWLDGPDKRMVELIDGVLVEKPVGAKESILAIEVAFHLRLYCRKHDAGLVFGADSPFRLRLGLVRYPDVSFVSWDQVPGDEFPDNPIAKQIPDLAVEVLSPSNTFAEIELKLDHYFEVGVRQAWVINPKKRSASIYTSRHRVREIGVDGEFTGSKILPGFRLMLREVFAAASRKKKRKPR